MTANSSASRDDDAAGERAARATRISFPEPSAQSSPRETILALQRSAGNRAVGLLMRQSAHKSAGDRRVALLLRTPTDQPPSDRPGSPATQTIAERLGVDLNDLDVPRGSDGHSLKPKGAKNPPAREVQLADKLAAEAQDTFVFVKSRNEPGIDGFLKASQRSLQLKSLSGSTVEAQTRGVINHANDAYANAQKAGWAGVHLEMEVPEATRAQVQSAWTRAMPGAPAATTRYQARLHPMAGGHIDRIRVHCHDGVIELRIPGAPEPAPAAGSGGPGHPPAAGQQGSTAAGAGAAEAGARGGAGEPAERRVPEASTKATEAAEAPGPRVTGAAEAPGPRVTEGRGEPPSPINRPPDPSGGMKAAVEGAGVWLVARQLGSLRGAEYDKAVGALEFLGYRIHYERSRGFAVSVTLVLEVPNDFDPFAHAAGVGDRGQVVYFKEMYIEHLVRRPKRRPPEEPRYDEVEHHNYTRGDRTKDKARSTFHFAMSHLELPAYEDEPAIAPRIFRATGIRSITSGAPDDVSLNGLHRWLVLSGDAVYAAGDDDSGRPWIIKDALRLRPGESVRTRFDRTTEPRHSISSVLRAVRGKDGTPSMIIEDAEGRATGPGDATHWKAQIIWTPSRG